eukprot:3905673-Amphidinium_carterae.2
MTTTWLLAWELSSCPRLLDIRSFAKPLKFGGQKEHWREWSSNSQSTWGCQLCARCKDHPQHPMEWKGHLQISPGNNVACCASCLEDGRWQETGKPSIVTCWMDCNKSPEPCEWEIRIRLAVQETQGNSTIRGCPSTSMSVYAATPPLETSCILASLCMSQGGLVLRLARRVASRGSWGHDLWPPEDRT